MLTLASPRPPSGNCTPSSRLLPPTSRADAPEVPSLDGRGDLVDLGRDRLGDVIGWNRVHHHQLRHVALDPDLAVHEGLHAGGLILVGLAEGALDLEVNQTKIGVKLVVAIAVAALTEIAAARARKGQPVAGGMVHAAGALAVVNVLVASLWK